MATFAEQLAHLRTGKNLTVKEICAQVSIPQSRLSELERGVRIPTAGQIDRIEAFFGLGPGELKKLVG